MLVLSSVVLVVIALAMTTVTGDHHQQGLKEHNDLLANIAEFPCYHPQPTVFSVPDFFPKEEKAHKAFLPDTIVLHRCYHSVGCCPLDHHCHPKHIHPLHQPLNVTFLEDVEEHKKGSWIIDYHKFDNHTECECVDVSIQHHQGARPWFANKLH